MRHFCLRAIAAASSLLLLASGFAGCGKNGGTGSGNGTNGLKVSLDHAYKSEKVDMGDMTSAEKYVNMGDKILAFGSGSSGYCYMLYDPASSTSKPVELEYPKTLPDSVYIRNTMMYWDTAGSKLQVIYDTCESADDDSDVSLGYTLESYDADFNRLDSHSITDAIGKKHSLEKITANPKGGCVASILDETSGNYSFAVFDADFRQTGNFPSSFTWIRDMFTSKDSVYVVAYGDSGLELNKLDLASGTTVIVKIDGAPTDSGTYFPSAVEQYDYYCSDSSDIYGVSVSGNKSEPVLNYINSDFLSSDANGGIAQLPDGRFLMNVYTDDTWSQADTWLLTARSADDFKNVKMITLSAMGLDSNLGRAVLSFNRTHTDARIAVMDYSTQVSTEGDFMENWDKAVDKMKNDMTSGVIADIICTSSIPYENFCNKGIFEDMTAHFDAYSSDSYFTNLFDALKYNGKLYRIVPCFNVSTLLAKTELVGSKQGITLDEMMQLVEKCGKDCKPFGTWTRESATSYLIGSMLNSFTDTQNATCNFNTPEFAKLLEFIKTLPEQYEEGGIEDEMEAYVKNKALFRQAYFSGNKSSYRSVHQGFDDKEVTYIGFPVGSSGGNGGLFTLTTPLSISSSSKNKEACYELIDYMLSEEYQNTLTYAFPVSRKAFAKQAERDSQPQMTTDEKGRQVKEPIVIYLADREKEIPDMPMSFAEDMENYISGIRDTDYRDNQIINIITEEANMFYAGDQDAAKAAESIQNRVSLYLQEQK